MKPRRIQEEQPAAWTACEARERRRALVQVAVLACCTLLAVVTLGDAGPPPEEAPGQAGPAAMVAVAADTGWASYYGARFAGRSTASGETFDPAKLTAAHRTLPFGTRVRVTSLRNGRAVVVRINDRGPHVPGRLIDLSRAAARRLGMLQRGTVRVRLQVVE